MPIEQQQNETFRWVGNLMTLSRSSGSDRNAKKAVSDETCAEIAFEAKIFMWKWSEIYFNSCLAVFCVIIRPVFLKYNCQNGQQKAVSRG